MIGLESTSWSCSSTMRRRAASPRPPGNASAETRILVSKTTRSAAPSPAQIALEILLGEDAFVARLAAPVALQAAQFLQAPLADETYFARCWVGPEESGVRRAREGKARPLAWIDGAGSAGMINSHQTP